MKRMLHSLNVIGRLIFVILALIVASSCSLKSRIGKTMNQSDVLSSDFTGFYLYDIDNQKVIYDKWGDKLFTPASNIKLITLFSALRILGDTLPAFYYRESRDSLIVWGSGSPLFLHHFFPPNPTYDFLRNYKGKLFLSLANFHDTPFGPGWSWDDMPYYYSAERSSFPVYGNTLRIKSINDSIRVFPKSLSLLLNREFSGERNRWKFSRNWYSSLIQYEKGNTADTLEREIPFQTSSTLMKWILEDTLKRDIQIADIPFQKSAAFYIYGADSLYKRMMQESDNFLAEQILLMCAGRVSDSLSTEIAINHVLQNYLQDLPDPPVWVDGSGLSRYNLISPRDVAAILEKIYYEIGMMGIRNIFAAGGESGTIRDFYAMTPPFVYAKTGTLSGVHNLSGYLITQSGRVLIFSFMNNNYRGPSAPFKNEMDKILRLIYKKF